MVVCPTVTAYEMHGYRAQMERIEPFARRVHIDLMDGMLAPTVSPALERIWWPPQLTADIHLMYQRPMEQLQQLITRQPHLVIIHAEADVHHMHFAAELHNAGIQAGLALLQDTPVAHVLRIAHAFDQILIFSGNLGHHGGHANLRLLEKVKIMREHHPDAEIAWDGGINDQNAGLLIRAGVTVLNVGGFIQNSPDPQKAYATLEALED